MTLRGSQLTGRTGSNSPESSLQFRLYVQVATFFFWCVALLTTNWFFIKRWKKVQELKWNSYESETNDFLNRKEIWNWNPESVNPAESKEIYWKSSASSPDRRRKYPKKAKGGLNRWKGFPEYINISLIIELNF